jgi:hypothetical protein
VLHSFAVTNFRSFLERTEISLVLTDKDAVNGWDRRSPITDQRITTAMAVMGANASGKTSLIQALAFAAWFVRHSFSAAPDDPIPVLQHFNGRDRPAEFEIIADGTGEQGLLRYQLSVSPTTVVRETLEQKSGRGSWRLIFARSLGSSGFLIDQDGFGLEPAQAGNVRANASLISWAAQFGVPLAKQFVDTVILANINAVGRMTTGDEEFLRKNADFYVKNPDLQSRMRELLAQWDLGLSDVEFHELEVMSERGEPEKAWFAAGVHLDKRKNKHLLHFAFESSGTKAAYSLLVPLLPVLKFGGLLIFDELDNDLHPHMLQPVLELFSNPETNPHRAQIIFTCHTVEVLRHLQKSQVVLVEKDGLESQAWRLDSMEGVRSDDNRVAKYLAGTYGGVPRF